MVKTRIQFVLVIGVFCLGLIFFGRGAVNAGMGDGHALFFDGINDYVDIPHNATWLNFDDGTFTIEIWVKTESTGYIFTKRDSDGAEFVRWTIEGGGHALFKVGFDSNAPNSVLSTASTTVINDGQWHHLTALRDGDTVKIYVDGVLEGSSTNNLVGSGDNDGHINLGKLVFWSLSGLWDGHLDEARLWGDVRTQAEIQANMNGSLVGTETDLLAYWSLNDGSGGVVADMTGHGNDGTLTLMDTRRSWAGHLRSPFNSADNNGLIINNGGFLQDTGDDLTFQHDGADFDITSADVPAGVVERWSRYWTIVKEDLPSHTGGNVTMIFDLPSAEINGKFVLGGDYKLLKRAVGGGGSFAIVPATVAFESITQVAFVVDGATLAGEFTLGGPAPIPSCYATPDNGTTQFYGYNATEIREAITQAGGGGVVKIAGICHGTIPVTGVAPFALGHTLYITNSIHLIGGYDINAGNPDWSATPDPTAYPTILDAEGKGKVIGVYGSGLNITIENLTLQNGLSQATTFYTAPTSNDGGGLFVQDSTVVISQTRIISNSFGTSNAGSHGGGIYNYDGDITLYNTEVAHNGNSAIHNDGGVIRLIDSQVEHNENYGVWNYNSASNGFPQPTLLITDTTISHNNYGIINLKGTVSLFQSEMAYNNGTNLFGAYVLRNINGMVSIERSTIRYNGTITEPMRIIYNLADGAFFQQAVMTIRNSTISHNVAENSVIFGGGTSVSETEIMQSTISDNTVGAFSSQLSISSNQKLKLGHTIIANSSNGRDCQVTGVGFVFTDNGNNLIESSNIFYNCGLVNGSNGNVIGSDPLLAPLGQNGGATETHALLAGSLAIDAGNNATCLALDQRTVSRPKDGDSNGSVTCDIGAFELDLACSPPSVLAPAMSLVGSGVQFSWLGGDHANVYRESEPYFMPAFPYASDVASVWSNAVGGNVYYTLRALNNCGESGDSQRMGVFNFAIVSGN